MNKVLKLTSAIFALLLVFALALGNVFHKQVRKWVDQNYIYFNIKDADANRLFNQRHPDYWFNASTEKDSYYPYERILVYAKIARKSDMSVPQESVITAQFLQGGQTLPDIRGDSSIKLVYNPYQELWVGYWYPADTGTRGEITVRATAYLDNPQAPLQVETHFTVSERPQKFTLDKGLCFLGIDSKERIQLRSMLSPTGDEVDWNVIPSWLPTISADGILMLGGITKTFDVNVSLDSPWNRDKISEANTLAERTRGIGRKFGVWIKSLELEGTYLEKIGYTPSLYLNGGNYARADSIVSYADQNRKKHLVDLFTSFMQNSSVDYVGLSHVFHPDNYDVELFETFFKEFQIAVPANWTELSFDQKFRYFAAKMSDPAVMKEFLRWKNYEVADYLKDVISKSGHSKPIFYLMNQDELLRNPEITEILFSSGVDFIVLNVHTNYLKLADTLTALKANTDLEKYYDRVVASYEIDYEKVDIQGFRLSAMENYIDGNMQILKFGSDEHAAQGLLINDLYKAMFGMRGPYQSYEWMIAVGKTIHNFKEMNTDYPLQVTSFTSMEHYASGIFPTEFRIANTTGAAINNVKITFLPVTEDDNLSGFNKTIATIGAGREMTFEIPIKINSQNPQLMKKRYFIGMRISWDPVPGGMYPESSYIDFIPLDMQNILSMTNSAAQQ